MYLMRKVCKESQLVNIIKQWLDTDYLITDMEQM